MDAYDLIVIGTGTAAQTASGGVRKAGRSVAVIDHGPFGGTCALRGCDPKKILVSGAETVDCARRMHHRGVVGELRSDWTELNPFKRTFTNSGGDVAYGMIGRRYLIIYTGPVIMT